MIIILTVFNKKSDESWYYSEMKVDELWQYSMGDSQTIAFIDKGITVISAAGDYDNKDLLFPAVDINAISLRDRGYKENTISGTSASCALASGYIALIREHAELNSTPLNNAQLMELLKNIKVKDKNEFNFSEPFEVINNKK